MDDFSWGPHFPGTILADQLKTTQHYWLGLTRYLSEFIEPFYTSTDYFSKVEQQKLLETPPMDSFRSYLELLMFTFDISNRGLISSLQMITDYNRQLMKDTIDASSGSLFDSDKKGLAQLAARQAKMMETVTCGYEEAIEAVRPEFGFRFEREDIPVIAETDRFVLYRIPPTDKGVRIKENAKPVLIIPPFVLGANILAFLPGEKRSYVHSFANCGVPTYIRITRPIESTEPVQTMTAEQEVLDTRYFCEKVMSIHARPVTLNGYCQGGFSAVCAILTGKLDGLVDALITCVSPMDGTRSRNFSAFLKKLPKRFNDLAYGTKCLTNGNRVADGELMGWIYKLKSIEKEAPFVSFYRDMILFTPRDGRTASISKAAAAIHLWLKYERNDLPFEITRISFASYNIPITEDGTLPVKLFGRELNFKRIEKKKIKWLICYGEKDDLVERDSALAPLDFVDAEVSPFPRGHVAIATSWSDPTSECALHTRFGEGNFRGPVRFHLDLDENP